MNIELMKALISLVQQGGWFAIGGVAIWGTIGIIKVCLVVYLVKIIITFCYKGYSNQLSLKALQRKESIVLLSEEVSKKLCTTLETFQKDTTEAMQYFLKESEDILKPLRKDVGDEKETKNTGTEN